MLEYSTGAPGRTAGASGSTTGVASGTVGGAGSTVVVVTAAEWSASAGIGVTGTIGSGKSAGGGGLISSSGTSTGTFATATPVAGSTAGVVAVGCGAVSSAVTESPGRVACGWTPMASRSVLEASPQIAG